MNIYALVQLPNIALAPSAFHWRKCKYGSDLTGQNFLKEIIKNVTKKSIENNAFLYRFFFSVILLTQSLPKYPFRMSHYRLFDTND
jgi:hypothetical protein